MAIVMRRAVAIKHYIKPAVILYFTDNEPSGR
jgi:hypothetical protein